MGGWAPASAPPTASVRRRAVRARGPARPTAAAELAAGAPEKLAAPIRRTPHLDMPPEPLQPGTTFEVLVYVDQKAARTGEETADVEVETGSEVEIQLIVSKHFRVNGSAVTTMEIKDEPRSDAKQRFSVSVLPENELPKDIPPGLIAQFFYKGRPSGKVSRAVRIAGVATQAITPTRERVEVQEGTAADLTVVVVGVANDGRQFSCTVRSPWLEKYKVGVIEPWNLPQAAEDIVLDFMERITADAITPGMLLAELRGQGRQLFDSSPKNFQQAFWDLIDSGHEIKRIALVTQEPYIPWELMIPYRWVDGKRQQRGALGTEFSFGRWPTPYGISARQKIPLVDSFVISPVYAPPLSFTQDEANLVKNSFAGEIITPANFDNIEKNLGGQGKSLVHFCCHGEDQETLIAAIGSRNENEQDKRTRSRVQIIRLENGQTLNSTQILGMAGVDTIFEQKHPLVFLNACEVGRGIPALLGVGGFAKSFLDLGASAVIAPLWSVKDTIAHEIAETFYKRVKAEPNTPFAEILRDLRRKAYTPGEAQDTYAAYCFYGDPGASRASDG